MSTESGSPSATVHQLYPGHASPKRPRGRPRKWPGGEPPSAAFDATRYDEVEAACKRTPKKKIPAIKDWIADRADKDRLSSAARAVLNYVIRHFNWDEGCDWHAESTIAQDKEISVRTVERGREELRKRGYTVMQRIPDERKLPGFKRRQHGTKPWMTTLPIVVDAIAALAPLDPTINSDWTRQDNAPDPTEKEAWTRQEISPGPDNIDGQTLIEKRKRKSEGGAARTRRERIRLDSTAELDPQSEAMIVALGNGLTPEQAHRSFGNLRRWAVEGRKSWPNLAAFLDRWDEWTRKDAEDIQARAGKPHFGSASSADIAEQAFNIEETTT